MGCRGLPHSAHADLALLNTSTWIVFPQIAQGLPFVEPLHDGHLWRFPACKRWVVPSLRLHIMCMGALQSSHFELRRSPIGVVQMMHISAANALVSFPALFLVVSTLGALARAGGVCLSASLGFGGIVASFVVFVVRFCSLWP